MCIFVQDESAKISSLEEELTAIKMENDILRNEVDAFKASLIKLAERDAHHPETQVIIARAESANRALKKKTEVLAENQVGTYQIWLLNGSTFCIKATFKY